MSVSNTVGQRSCVSNKNNLNPVMDTIQFSELAFQLAQEKSEDCFYIAVTVFGQKYFALIDSGCNGIVINQKIADLHVSPLPKSEAKGQMANGSTIGISWIDAPVSFGIGSQKVMFNTCTAPIAHDIILGMPFITRGRVKFDFDRNRIVFSNEFVPNAKKEMEERHQAIIAQLELFVTRLLELNPPRVCNIQEMDLSYETEAKKILSEFDDVIRNELPKELPPRRKYNIVLRLKPGTVIKNHPVYRMSEKERIALRKILKDYLEAQLIYPTNTAFASPAFLIPKKNEEFRLLTDMRQVNEGLEDIAWPIPNIQDLLDRTRGSKI